MADTQAGAQSATPPSLTPRPIGAPFSLRLRMRKLERSAARASGLSGVRSHAFATMRSPPCAARLLSRKTRYECDGDDNCYGHGDVGDGGDCGDRAINAADKRNGDDCDSGPGAHRNCF